MKVMEVLLAFDLRLTTCHLLVSFGTLRTARYVESLENLSSESKCLIFWHLWLYGQVPKGRSAVAVAQLIREKFFDGRREAEFLVVCDVKKENAQIVSELNDAQVCSFISPLDFVQGCDDKQGRVWNIWLEVELLQKFAVDPSSSERHVVFAILIPECLLKWFKFRSTLYCN